MKRKSKPSGTDGRNILILEPRGERQKLANSNGGPVSESGNGIPVLRASQGLQGHKVQAPNKFPGARA